MLSLEWLKAVQTFATFSFITNILFIMFLVIVATTNYRASVKVLTTTATLSALTCIFSMIAVAIFGAYADVYRELDRFTGLGLDTFGKKGKWMPRPEYTVLSWSYVCEVFVTVFTLISSELTIKWIKQCFYNFYLIVASNSFSNYHVLWKLLHKTS